MNDTPLDVIPHGLYCYTDIENEKNWSYKFKVCPYWELRADKPVQENGYCHYLQTGDWEYKDSSMLWDQVKECGIND